MNGFSSDEARKLMKALEEDMKAIGEKHGVTLHFGGGSLSSNQISAKLTISRIIENPDEALAQQKAEFEKYCGMYGLTRADYGRVVSVRVGRTKVEQFKLIGFAPSRSAFPLRVLRVGDGKEMLLRVSAVKDSEVLL